MLVVVWVCRYKIPSKIRSHHRSCGPSWLRGVWKASDTDPEFKYLRSLWRRWNQHLKSSERPGKQRAGVGFLEAGASASMGRWESPRHRQSPGRWELRCPCGTEWETDPAQVGQWTRTGSTGTCSDSADLIMFFPTSYHKILQKTKIVDSTVQESPTT